jgi:hypothetical protein
MYDLSSVQEPFWAKSGNFVRGRDPLGIQNSSISVYATLLPGLTNLTLRIRYYGFYLWLLDEFLQLDEKDPFKQSVDAHYSFIRRGELILAFLMGKLHPTELSVIGSDYVSNNLDQLQQLGYYDIEHGADKTYQTEEHKVYWDYKSGALGQYYAGSLIGLDLIEQRQGYFRRTDVRGAELATAFRNSVANAQRELFLKRIVEGRLYEEDFHALDQFALNAPIHDLEEGQFYFKMLLDKDGSKIKTYEGEFPSQRKETIRLFLEKMKEDERIDHWYSIPRKIYQANLDGSKEPVSEAEFGWYLYQLNEFVHYYLEAIFWGLLEEMDGKEYAVQAFLSEMTTPVNQYCITQLGLKQSSIMREWLNEVQLDTEENIAAIGAQVKAGNTFEVIGRSIAGLLQLYKENSAGLDELKRYALNHHVHDKNGNAMEVFNRYLDVNKSLPTDRFIRNVIHTLMNEHIAIAYYKMGSGEKNLLKFMIEDNYLVHIETMRPNFTNPRIRALLNFMVDLGVLDANGKRLEIGDRLMEELNLNAQ